MKTSSYREDSGTKQGELDIAQYITISRGPFGGRVLLADDLVDSGLTHADISNYDFRLGEGCGQCRGSGFKGRKAISEMLNLNDEIREMIVAREPIRKIKEAARRNGTRFLREAALELVAGGETTLQEINRVTFVA